MWLVNINHNTNSEMDCRPQEDKRIVLVQKSVFFCKWGMGKHNSDPQWPEAVIASALS